MADLRQARKPDQKKKRGKTVTVWNNKFIHLKQKKNINKNKDKNKNKEQNNA